MPYHKLCLSLNAEVGASGSQSNLMFVSDDLRTEILHHVLKAENAVDMNVLETDL